jgi:hypothetical protein
MPSQRPYRREPTIAESLAAAAAIFDRVGELIRTGPQTPEERAAAEQAIEEIDAVVQPALVEEAKERASATRRTC